uniref:Uncharacterized protein n=1 Tax=Lactuca sativa TaxID=4236 RepID=A0A9R1XTN1_LACSA|nr:hypothetical protein LSAT_V11C100025590 [Lactuca sativa]
MSSNLASVDFLPEPQTREGSVACISETTASAARQLGLTSVGELAGIAVGATVMLNIHIAGYIYLTAPILGALAGAGIYTAVKLPEEDDV